MKKETKWALVIGSGLVLMVIGWLALTLLLLSLVAPDANNNFKIAMCLFSFSFITKIASKYLLEFANVLKEEV